MQRGASNSGLLKAFTAFRLGLIRARPVHKESAGSHGLFHAISRGKQTNSLGHSSTDGSREGQDGQASCSNDSGERDVWQNYLKSYATRHYMTLSPENVNDQDFKKEPAAPCSPVHQPSRGLLNAQGYSHKTVQGIRQTHRNSTTDDIEPHKEQQELEAETEAEIEAGTTDDVDKSESLLELPDIRMVPCRYQMMLGIDGANPEEEAGEESGEESGEEDQFQIEPILLLEKNVDPTADVDANPYTIGQTLEGAPEDKFDDAEAQQDGEQKEAQEPETEPEAEIEPFQQQQPMGHSTMRVTASDDGSDGRERPQADSDRRFKEKASASEAEDEADDSGPRDRRDSMEPTDEFIRTDRQRHKEREYEGIYWNGKGERYDSRLDIAEGEDTGYVTGKGTPLPRPEPQPIPLVPEKK
ncbi:GL15924 [Drosophila persimilis]|uniref:GL15924 n=1 Tax=Drosophila persimilis TaxID=7234 RepID=B4H0Q5_DROPE|nr:GL15924 [Drosophila persimilis]